MSRIGKRPVAIPSGVEVKIDGNHVKVKGPKGSLERTLHSAVKLVQEGSEITVSPVVDDSESKKFHGLSRTLLANMVEGCSKGFEKRLKLIGVGYRAAKQGNALNFTLGYSHPILFEAVAGIDLNVDKQTTIIVTGASKEDVGETAAKIRALRPPEPYHGKGVRYENEHIATKVGKAAGKK
ncbi:50S ribosomal protein L6 [Pseudobacteriovorax antillogorgiicola]|uniref:Large ribosomal subunit protein uL6 n=1 Tax=Pseudobacteriovorax antillogorgiicola TaxID=1513793 RepID=A0A1Y6B301_9BACT|nr:50S ribosomal protein L6 [Pseudobacteriovorax antillogorgiicola]TCS59376.1 LSU ribosomal protein L6P [Pseudobacteriovorax antillogorgiicola]SME88816.1 LSU ribosomal protein L6P [Pseudobacteriovorax antillogorgiicola]